MELVNTLLHLPTMADFEPVDVEPFEGVVTLIQLITAAASTRVDTHDPEMVRAWPADKNIYGMISFKNEGTDRLRLFIASLLAQGDRHKLGGRLPLTLNREEISPMRLRVALVAACGHNGEDLPIASRPVACSGRNWRS